MEDHVATGGDGRARTRLDRAGQGSHGDIVTHQQTGKPQPTPNHIPDQSDRSGGRSNRIDGRVDNMGGHAQRQIRQRAECGKVALAEGVLVGLDHGKRMVAVGRGPAVAGDMLEHRQNAPLEQAVGHRARQRRDFVRTLPVSAVADDRIGAACRHVGHRQAINVDPDGRKIGGDEARTEIGRPDPVRRIAIVQTAIGGAGRIGGPMRRAETLDTAALLIHEHGHIAAGRLAHGANQTAQLRGRLDVALEDDESPRLVLAHERAFGGAQRRARKASDECTYRHWRGLARA